MSQQHKGFQHRHDKSDRALLVSGLWFHRQGKEVRIPGKRQAPTAAEHMDYVDNGDLFLREDDGREVLVEVHGYNIDFTDVWPFPDVILKSVGPADRLGLDNVDRFVICNRNYTHAAIVYGRPEHPRFHVEKKWIRPRNTGNPEQKYVCSPVDVVCVDLRLEPPKAEDNDAADASRQGWDVGR